MHMKKKIFAIFISWWNRYTETMSSSCTEKGGDLAPSKWEYFEYVK
jgi:hypothetical protein